MQCNSQKCTLPAGMCVRHAVPASKYTLYITLTSVYLPGRKPAEFEEPSRCGPFVVAKVNFGASKMTKQCSFTVDDWEAACVDGAYPKPFEKVLSATIASLGAVIEHVSFSYDCCPGGVFHGVVTPYLLVLLNTIKELKYTSIHNACFYDMDKYRACPKLLTPWKYTIDSWAKMPKKHGGNIKVFSDRVTETGQPLDKPDMDKVVLVKNTLYIREPVPETHEHWVDNAIRCLGAPLVDCQTGEPVRRIAQIHPSAAKFLEPFARSARGRLSVRITFFSPVGDSYPVSVARGVLQAVRLHAAGRLLLQTLFVRGLRCRTKEDVECWAYVFKPLKNCANPILLMISEATSLPFFGRGTDEEEETARRLFKQLVEKSGANTEKPTRPGSGRNMDLAGVPVEDWITEQRMLAERRLPMKEFKQAFAQLQGIEDSRIQFFYRDLLVADHLTPNDFNMGDTDSILMTVKGGH